MAMKVLALEEEDIQVLNYAPGPVDTDMYATVTESTGDSETKALLKETRDSGHILTCLQTVRRLVGVLESKKYVNGEHVDYFEVDDQGETIVEEASTT